MNDVQTHCIIVIILNSILLVLLHFRIDPYKNIERHMFKEDKPGYLMYKLSYFIIIISLFWSIRHMFFEGVSSVTQKLSHHTAM
jgi:uncharacterized membrane protein